MNIIKTLTLATALLGLGTVQTVALADSTEAICKFFKKGELREKASGPCRFSQRQGYVDITLRNGRSFSLSPANQANHFKDQKGNKVVRTVRGNGNHKYKWEHKRVVVSFDPDSSSNAHPGNKTGETPPHLKDLVGQYGGEAEDQLMERGYVLRNSSKSGRDVYSNWQHRRDGQCITVRSDAKNGRYKSIVYTMEYDCRK